MVAPDPAPATAAKEEKKAAMILFASAPPGRAHVEKEIYILGATLLESPRGPVFNRRDARDEESDRKSTRLNSSHRSLSRMPSSA